MKCAFVFVSGTLVFLLAEDERPGVSFFLQVLVSLVGKYPAICVASLCLSSLRNSLQDPERSSDVSSLWLSGCLL